MAAKCEFEGQTEGLIYDIFILNMRNKYVQEKLSTEPKDDPQEGLRFAVAYEEGIQRQKSYEATTAPQIKSEPIYNVETEKNDKKECFRCGASNFSLAHMKVCRARGEKCNNCGGRGHYARLCQKSKQAKQRRPDTKNRVNRVTRASDSSPSSDDTDAQVIMHVNQTTGTEDTPFMLNGFIDGKKFSALIDLGSPITTFSVEE